MVMPKAGRDAYFMIHHLYLDGMPEDRALDFLRPIVDAVCHLHRLGFAHQDIKTENIMVRYRLGGAIDHVCLIGTAHTIPTLQHHNPRFDVIQSPIAIRPMLQISTRAVTWLMRNRKKHLAHLGSWPLRQ